MITNRFFRRPGVTRLFQMFHARIMLAVLLGTMLGGAALSRAANIVWVTDNLPADGFSALGGTVFAEDGWYTLLTNAGHKVIRFNPPNAQATVLTAQQFADLNTNDLIILGRSVGSGHFQAPAVGGWNSNIFKPILSINSYLTRNNRAGWFTVASVPNGAPITLTALNLADPKTAYIFSGVAMSGNTTVNVYDEAGGQNTSQTTDAPTNGFRIATSSANGWNVICDWPSNNLVRANLDRLGGYRMHFAAGLRETAGLGVPTAGGENLTADGENMFLRAVEIAINNGNLPTPPPTPTNVAGISLNAQAQVGWSIAPFSAGYYIQRSLTPGGPYTPIATNGTSTGYADFAVVNDTTYYYVIVAFNSAGQSAASAEVAVTPKDAPVNLVAVGGTNQVAVSWDAFVGALSYTLKRSSSAAGPFTSVASGLVGPSHTDATAAAGQVHYYVVVAQTGGGDSGQSATVSATTAPAASVISTVLFASTVLRAGWTAGGQSAGYLYETSADGVTFAPALELSASTLSFTNAGLSPLTSYFYRVQSTNASGFSPYSNVASNSTPAFGYNINIANGPNSSQNTNSAPVPPGYVVDEGEIFGDRTNGLFYGWTTVGGTNLTRETRRRQSALSPDVRYDTLNQMMRNPVNNPAFSAIWEIELTNGFYEVHVVGGDAGATDSTFQFSVEGVLSPAVAGTVSRWSEFTTSVGVSDGRLTISSGPLALNNKLCFIDIYPAVPTLPAFLVQPVPVTVEQSRPSTLTATAQGSPNLAFQWYQNDTPVAGATNASLSYVHTPLAAAGSYYLVVTNYGGSVTSDVVALTVNPDVTPPTMISVGSLDGNIVGVQFDEEIDPNFVIEASNFVINGGGGVGPLSATLRPDGRSVKLVLDMPITGPFTVDVYDVADYSGVLNPLTGTNSTVLGFTVGDIGAPVAAGTHVTFDNNTIEMNGGGADFWAAADQGYLATTPLLGDFDVRVRVNGLTRPDNVAKAAILARESRDANSRGLHFSVNPLPPGRNQYETAWRATTGGNSATVGASFTPAGIPNAWLRLTRAGSIFTSFRSSNGVDWVQLGVTNQVHAPTMFVGLGVTAHTNGGLIATGTFSGLTITQPARAELSITKTASTNLITAGQPVSYLITISNAGPDVATNVVVNDTLSALGTLGALTPSQGTLTSSTNTFTWDAGTLAVGGTATINVTATASAAGSLTNSATVASELNDPNAANNAASVVVQVVLPVPPVLAGSGYTNGVFFASFASASGVGYEVQYRHALPSLPCVDLQPCPGPDPTPWTTLTNLPGTGAVIDFTDPTPATTNRFYRIIVR